MITINTIKSMNEKPTYQHDCNSCKFLGTTLADGKVVDLYFCPKEPTIIARYSDEGSDYASGIIFGERGSMAELEVAYLRAVRQELITPSHSKQ